MSAGYELTKTGVVFQRELTDAEYDALGRKIAHIANATAWAIGDWLAAGAGRGPDGSSYDRAHALTGRSYESLGQYARMSATYAIADRGIAAWTLYREALRLPAAERVTAVSLARQNEWNRNGLVDYINTRLDQRNALSVGAHQSGGLQKHVGRKLWRKDQSAPKRDVCCPQCGHRFDVRRKNLTEAPIEPVSNAQPSQRSDHR